MENLDIEEEKSLTNLTSPLLNPPKSILLYSYPQPVLRQISGIMYLYPHIFQYVSVQDTNFLKNHCNTIITPKNSNNSLIH